MLDGVLDLLPTWCIMHRFGRRAVLPAVGRDDNLIVVGDLRTVDGCTRSADGVEGDVPEWTKGADCKSVIRGFESHRRLTLFLGNPA